MSYHGDNAKQLTKIHAYGVFATQNSAVWQTEGFIAECLLPSGSRGTECARGFPAVRLQTPGC
ncbi:hypothetical protein DMC46_14855 [Escherichia coli]|nr:hypothetical protein [Escherichia coli]EGE1766252.1 hypothetical protein [Escherichia coli]